MNGINVTITDMMNCRDRRVSIQNELIRGRSTPDALTDFLEEVRQRCRFRYWFFGHYHDNGIVRERFVLLYEQMIRIK